MKIVRKMIVTILAITILSCASTKTASMVNPNVEIREYRTLLVLAPFQDLEERKIAENALVEEFSKLNLTVLRGIDVIPPVKTIH